MEPSASLALLGLDGVEGGLVDVGRQEGAVGLGSLVLGLGAGPHLPALVLLLLDEIPEGLAVGGRALALGEERPSGPASRRVRW